MNLKKAIKFLKFFRLDYNNRMLNLKNEEDKTE